MRLKFDTQFEKGPDCGVEQVFALAMLCLTPAARYGMDRLNPAPSSALHSYIVLITDREW